MAEEASPPEPALPSEPVSPPLGESPRARRKSPWRRILLLSFLLPAVLLVSAFVLVLSLPWIVTEERVRTELVSALTESLGAPAGIERIDYHPLSGIELFGVRIGPPPGFQRDVLRAERIALRYDLSGLAGGTVKLRTIAIDVPQVVIERNGERTNIGTIQARLAEGAAPEARSEEPSEPLRGAISPITVVLEGFAITNASLEVTGDGPNARLSGATLEIDADLDPSRLRARVLFTMGASRGAGATEHSPNIVFSRPATAEGGAPLSASMHLALTTSVAASADASDGIGLELVRLGMKGLLSGEVLYGGSSLPRTAIGLGVDLEAKPHEDAAELRRFYLGVNDSTLVDAAVAIDGLSALAKELLGGAGASAIAGWIGLGRRPSGEGVVTLVIRELAMPLTTLAPYVSMLVPGIDVGGRIALAPVEVEGTLSELLAGMPRRLSIGLGIDGVRATIASPDSAPLAVASLDGRIDAVRTASGAASPFELGGVVRARNVVRGSTAVDLAELEVHAGAQRLGYPDLGEAAVRLRLALSRLSLGASHVRGAELAISVGGKDLFDDSRSTSEPILAAVDFESDAIHVASGTTSIDMRELRFNARAALDRLLASCRNPIEATIDARAGGITLGGEALSVRRGDLSLDARVTDPRAGSAVNVTANLSTGAHHVHASAIDLEGPRIRWKVSGEGVDLDRLRKIAAGEGLGRIASDLDVALPRIAVRDAALGDFETAVLLATSADARLGEGVVILQSLALRIGDLIKIRASGRVRGIFSKARVFGAKLDVDPVDLERALSLAPPGLLRNLPGIRASGTAGLSLRAGGVLPERMQALDLENPPLDAEVGLALRDVGLSIPSEGLEIDGLGGAFSLDVHKERTEVGTTMTLGKLVRRKGEAEARVESLALRFLAGLKGDTWRVSTDVQAVKLVSGLGAREAVEGARFDFDLVYPKRGDLDLRRLEIVAPGSGLELSLKGRLSRRRFGVFRPSAELRALLDFDKLRLLVPEIGDAHGKLAATVGVDVKQETKLRAEGRVELENLSYAIPGVVSIENASGGLPIEQRLELPPPKLREDVTLARGVLGDDLEARLRELSEDLLQFKAYLDAEDILLDAPGTADYDALRPYRRPAGARITTEKIVYKGHTLEDVTLEGLWRTGVLRIDRFAAHVWEGDVHADLALQVTADQNVRVRLRATVTELNSDIPYAAAKQIAPVADPGEKADYKISGTMDFKFALKERSVNGSVDLSKFRKPTVERFLGAMDPEGKNGNINRAKAAMEFSEFFGLRPSSGRIWISQNLMRFSLEWKRLWLPVSFYDWKAVFRWALIPTFGSFIVANVNGAFGDDGISVSNILEPIFVDAKLDQRLAVIGGKVIAEENRTKGATPQASP